MNATKMVSKRITDQIFEIIRKLEIKDKWASVYDKLKLECDVIHANFHEIHKIFKGKSLSWRGREIAIRTSYPKLSKYYPISNVVLWTSPLWIPPALLLLPFAALVNFLKPKWDIRRYKNDKMSYMNKLAKNSIKKYDLNAIHTGLCLSLLQPFMSFLQEICEDIIPNKIKADQELLKNISKENRDSQTLIKECTPIELRCMEHIENLLYVKMKYPSDKPIRILKEGGFIGKGSYAEVYQCDANIGGCKLECAVKRLTTALQHSDGYLQLSEAENMM